jgi:hypothetical protein
MHLCCLLLSLRAGRIAAETVETKTVFLPDPSFIMNNENKKNSRKGKKDDKNTKRLKLL